MSTSISRVPLLSKFRLDSRAGGSANGSSGHAFMECFDPREGIWTPGPPMVFGRAFCCAAFGGTEFLYVMGGSTATMGTLRCVHYAPLPPPGPTAWDSQYSKILCPIFYVLGWLMTDGGTALHQVELHRIGCLARNTPSYFFFSAVLSPVLSDPPLRVL